MERAVYAGKLPPRKLDARGRLAHDGPTVTVTRFTLFNHLWAIAGFCEWHRWTWTESGGSAALLATSIALFVFPNSVACLAVYAATQVVFTALAMNAPWNHGLFMAFLNVGILLAIARCAFEKHWDASSHPDAPSSWDGEKLLETFAPAFRLSLIFLYLWTGFHKLNVDFLDPGVSCAGALMGWMNEVYRFLPLERWAVIGAIAGTLVIELTVPVLLCFRRTVYFGLAMGAGFHLFLSQYGGLHGFAAMLFAIYYLFLPSGFTDRIRQRLSAFDTREWFRHALPLIALAGLVVGKALGHFWGLSYTLRGQLFWDVWLVAVVVVFGREFVNLIRIRPGFTLRPRWAPLWVIPLVTLVNGAMPYLGLKTETSWAMYSNLRTAYAPNHLLVPESARVFGFQDDLLAIEDTTLPAFERFAGEPVALTPIAFRHIASAADGDFDVTVRVGDERKRLIVRDGVSTHPAWTEPVPWIVGRLLLFRPVDTTPRARCRH